MIQKQQRYLLNRADEACDLIRSHIEKEHVVRIISHNDADGLTSAGILANAVKKAGGRFHVTILPRLRTSNIDELRKTRYKLFIFSDMGSGNVEAISKLKGDVVIADHHQSAAVCMISIALLFRPKDTYLSLFQQENCQGQILIFPMPLYHPSVISISLPGLIYIFSVFINDTASEHNINISSLITEYHKDKHYSDAEGDIDIRNIKHRKIDKFKIYKVGYGAYSDTVDHI